MIAAAQKDRKGRRRPAGRRGLLISADRNGDVVIWRQRRAPPAKKQSVF